MNTRWGLAYNITSNMGEHMLLGKRTGIIIYYEGNNMTAELVNITRR